MPRVREKGASGGFGEVARAGRGRIKVCNASTAGSVPEAPDTRPRGKERRRVGGSSRRRSPAGLARPDLIAKPGSYPTRQRSSNCQADKSPAFSRFHRLRCLLRLLRELGRFSSIGREAQPTAASPWLHSAWNERGRFTFRLRRCEGTLYGAPSRRLAGLASFGNGVCGTCAPPPNSRRYRFTRRVRERPASRLGVGSTS